MKKFISILLVLFLWVGITQAIPPFPTYPPQLGSDSAGRNLTIFATKGNELVPALTVDNWDVVGGWSLAASTLNHNAAGAGAITPIVSIAPTAGVTYKVVITLSAVTVENCSYTLGGVTGTLLASATTYTDYITATTNGDLTFTPFAATSRFTISAVSITALADGTGDLTIEGNLNVRSPAVFTSPLSVASGGTGVATSTGTVAVVLSNSPTLTTPIITIPEVDGSASVILTIAQVSNTIISNQGQAAANIALTLPAAAAGYSFIATVGTTQAGNTWKFTANGSDKIYLDGVAGTDGQSAIVTPAIGNFITFITFKSGAGTYDWIAQTGAGIWTAGA